MMKQPQPKPLPQPATLSPAHIGIIELLARIAVREHQQRNEVKKCM